MRSKDDDPNDVTECQHHWRIDTAKGKVSLGLCRRCGLVQEFVNFAEPPPWKRNSFKASNPKKK